jgi:hypothetical protein
MASDRKQTRISLPPDVARDFEISKKRAEEAAGVTFTDAQYLLALVKAEIERRKSSH